MSIPTQTIVRTLVITALTKIANGSSGASIDQIIAACKLLADIGEY